MNKQIRSLGKLVILALFIAVNIFSITKNAHATAIASVTYAEIWDSASSEWDYTYNVANHSNEAEVIYRFYLNSGLPVVSLTNITVPIDWVHATNNSEIEWKDSITNWPASGIYSGMTFSFNFSSDTKLGDLYYELNALGSIPIASQLTGRSTSVPVPEAATLSLLSLGLLFISKKRKNIVKN